MATPALHLGDEILEEILLRVPTPAALARASTASPRFRNIITERRFLRRYRKRHPPPLLGFVSDEDDFYPMDAPHPSAPLAHSLAGAADFTYSFVPKSSDERWTPCDVRDEDARASFPNLAVCDPFSRRYVLLPPIPEDLPVYFGLKLAPIGEDEDETSSFKVVCTANYDSEFIVFVFSSVAGQWCIAACTSWSSLGMNSRFLSRSTYARGCLYWAHLWRDKLLVRPSRFLSRSTYARGCLYWAHLWRDKLLVLDMHTMEFSTVNSGHIMQLIDQSGQVICWSTIVDGTKEALEMFTLVCDFTPEVSLYACQNTHEDNSESFGEPKLKSNIPVSHGFVFFIPDAAEGFLLLARIRAPLDDAQLDGELLPEDRNVVDLFSFEVKTSELQELCRATECRNPDRLVHSYYGFPPSLSKPSL